MFGSSAAIFDSLFAPRSGCTILCTVPLNPFDPYYKAELFPSLNAKLSANQNRYDRNLGQGKVKDFNVYIDCVFVCIYWVNCDFVLEKCLKNLS